MAQIKNIKNPNKLNFSSFVNRELEKAFQEGVYADTPQNRKLGRVGMSYKQVKEAQKEAKEKQNKLENSCLSGDHIVAKNYAGETIEGDYVKRYSDGSHIIKTSDGKQIHILKGSIVNRVSKRGEAQKAKNKAKKEHKKIKDIENEVYYAEKYTIPEFTNQMDTMNAEMESYIAEQVAQGKEMDAAANEWAEEYQKIEDEKEKVQEDIKTKKEQIKEFYEKNGRYGFKSEYGYDEELEEY